MQKLFPLFPKLLGHDAGLLVSTPLNASIWLGQDFNVKKGDLAPGEFILFQLPQVKDAGFKKPVLGTLILTNLRAMFIREDGWGGLIARGSSFGYSAIIGAIYPNEPASKLSSKRKSFEEGIKGIIGADIGFPGHEGVIFPCHSSVYSFIWEEGSVASSARRCLLLILGAFDRCGIYRNSLVRIPLTLSNNGKWEPGMLPMEKLYTLVEAVSNVAADRGSMGRAFITNLRFLWVSSFDDWNVSVPYVDVTYISKEHSEFGEVLILETRANMCLGFHCPPESLDEVAEEVRSRFMVAVKHPEFGLVQPDRVDQLLEEPDEFEARLAGLDAIMSAVPLSLDEATNKDFPGRIEEGGENEGGCVVSYNQAARQSFAARDVCQDVDYLGLATERAGLSLRDLWHRLAQPFTTESPLLSTSDNITGLLAHASR